MAKLLHKALTLPVLLYEGEKISGRAGEREEGGRGRKGEREGERWGGREGSERERERERRRERGGMV